MVNIVFLTLTFNLLIKKQQLFAKIEQKKEINVLTLTLQQTTKKIINNVLLLWVRSLRQMAFISHSTSNLL